VEDPFSPEGGLMGAPTPGAQASFRQGVALGRGDAHELIIPGVDQEAAS